MAKCVHLFITCQIIYIGKMDSDSDDLAEIATLLHKRNTARRVKELEQRDKYNAGDPGGAHDWAETKPYIPRTYSPYTSEYGI